MTLPPLDLDVRPILRDGGEPFSAIMDAVGSLAPGQALRLYATFKPLPLFQVLGARGFEPSAREIGGGDWEVVFTPSGSAPPAPPAAAVAEPKTAVRADADTAWPEPEAELDLRDLDPPEPMVQALAAVEALPAGGTVAALLPREPIFLFKQLEKRGHQWRGAFEGDGSYRVVIRAGSPAAEAAP